MNLHEIYATLMQRGMPKHRDLVWTVFAEPCVACALNGDVAILTTNTAYDLVAMHALRWWLTLKCTEPTTVGFGENDELGVPIHTKSRDTTLAREFTIASYAHECNDWTPSKNEAVYTGTDVFENDHYDTCSRYRAHDLNEDETRYPAAKVGHAMLSVILAATAHLEPKGDDCKTSVKRSRTCL